MTNQEPYQDQTITCQDCGTQFVFPAGEQQFWAQKGVQGAPRRCPDCRARLGRAQAHTIAHFMDRFDPAGGRVLSGAEAEARAMEHRWIGTEHLLLGLLRDSGGVGARVLRRLGMDLLETRAAVRYWMRGVPATAAPRGPTPAGERIGLAQRAQVALELASAAAAPPGPAGPEQLLSALLQGLEQSAAGPGVATAILQGFGVTADKVRATLPLVSGDGEADVAAPEPAPQEAPDEQHPLSLARAGRWDEVPQSLAQWREQRRKGRRYSLVLPDDLFEEVEQLAQRRHTTVVELLRRFTRLGLLAAQLQDRPDAALIFREGTTERELVLL